MTDLSTIETNEEPLLSSLLTRVLSSLNALGSLWIFALMILINSDAMGRTLFTAHIDGVPEMIELSIVGIVFLQLGDAIRCGRLTRSDGFYNLMMARSPRTGHCMGFVFDFLGMFFMAIILYGSFPILIEAYEGDFYIGNEGIFTAPTWPIKLIIVTGCTFTMLQFVAFCHRHIIALRNLAKT